MAGKERLVLFWLWLGWALAWPGIYQGQSQSLVEISAKKHGLSWAKSKPTVWPWPGSRFSEAKAKP
jgi:hypothetical protein